MFSPNGKFLASATTNSLIVRATRTWDVLRRLKVAGLFRGAIPGASLGLGLAFSPNGGRLAVMSNNGIRILSIPDLQQVALLKDTIPRNRPIAFSPDGHTVAAAAMGHAVKLWNIGSGSTVATLSGHSGSVFGTAFSPDGAKLATCSSDQTIKLWDVASGKCLRTFRGHTEEVWRVAFSPNGKLLASVSRDGAVEVWDASSRPRQVGRLFRARPFGFNGAGDLVVSPTHFNEFVAFDPESLRQEGAGFLPEGPGGSHLVAQIGLFSVLSDDGRTAFFEVGHQDASSPLRFDAAKSARFQIWDLTRRRLVCSLAAGDGGLLFAPKARLWATDTDNDSITLWRLPSRTRQCVLTNAGIEGGISPDGTCLLTKKVGSEEYQLWTVRGAAARRRTTLETNGGLSEPAFSPDGHLVAAGMEDNQIRIWAVPSGRVVATLTGHTRGGIHASFSAGGRTLASVSDDGTVRLWSVATGRELLKFNLPVGDVRDQSVEFSPDGRSLGAATQDESGPLTRLWFAPSFAEIRVAEGAGDRTLAHEPLIWLDVGKALERRNRLAEALNAYAEAIRGSTSDSATDPVRHVALVRRAAILARLGRFAEAGTDNCAAFDIPRRDPGTPRTCIDLSPDFDRSLDCEPLTPFLRALPRGVQTLPGTDGKRFEIRGVVQLCSKEDRYVGPYEVNGVRVHEKCGRLHFLESAHFREKEGAVVAAYVVHYADGQRAEVPVRYGRNVRDWVLHVDPGSVPDSRVAWIGTHPRYGRIRIFEQTWTNPRPDVQIATLDFVSKMTKCAPFLIAVTAER